MTEALQPSVLAELIPFHTSKDWKIGRLILNRPRVLNSLSREMLATIDRTLKFWADDKSVRMVWMEGAGEKAFCAGGDVASIYRLIQEKRASNESPLQPCQDFFDTEYRTDYGIHSYPKPIVVWGDGIVMGGGIGLMVGASHRIVTEKSLLAMPEVAIGLYPDVGASKFLSDIPGRIGLFLGLTGYRMNASDALFVDLADSYIPRAMKDALWTKLLNLDASSSNLAEHVSEVLKSFEENPEPSRLTERKAEIEGWMKGDTVQSLLEHFLQIQAVAEDSMLKSAQDSVRRGAPTSLGITFEQWRRSRGIGIEDAFKQEITLSVNCCLHSDFSEGVRALLVDKDNKPNWNPTDWRTFDPDRIESFFRSPWPENEHPLRNLGK